MKLTGKIAIITGGGSGIGEAIALRFAQEGADVVIADINSEASMAVVDKITKMGKKSFYIATDTSKANDAKKLAAGTVERFGRVDILVNNAGIINPGLFIEEKEETWDKILSVNMKGYFLVSQAVAKQMVKQEERGKIINIASDSGRLANIGVGVSYSLSKAAVIHLTRVIATELGPQGVNVNTVCPYATETPLTIGGIGDAWDEWKTLMASKSPLGKIGTAEEVAGPCVFFASDDADYITGQLLYLGAPFMP